ncbi:MAG TPA: toxin-antitoxin system YwqK family antitoxin [Bacteroidales bacterium]|nr:toxin-antitoxin system YwqK family antitoxin [Bacteroidales bacterium]
MKRILILVFFIFSCTLSFSQEKGTLKDGYQVFKYPNGTISSEGLIKNGKPEGFWKSFYVTGVKKSEGRRTNYLLDSIWVFYDQSGDTTEKINYLYGKKNGWYYKYKTDATKGIYILSKELYSADKKAGTAYVYFPDGKIQQTFAYNNGKKEGLSKEFDRDGNLITLLEYNNDFLVSREKINRTDKNGLKQGEWKEFYPNGSIKSEKTFKDDLIHGYYKEYDTRGKLVLTMLYENGAIVKSNVEDSPDIEIVNRHDQNGKLTYSGPYRNKVPVGVHRDYGSDGKVINAYIYNDNGLLLSEGIVDEAGKYNGKWKDLYADGKVQAEGQYTDSRRTGQWKFYNISGKVEQTGSYNNGRPDGLWNWYYEDGTLLKEEEYFQGQRDGLSTEYSDTGEIIAQGQYSDGEKNGEWKYKSGDITETGKYITGLRDGVWKSYYSNEKPKFKGNYVQGNPDGSQTFYYDNGKIKEEQYYEMGIRQKTWKKFDEEGFAYMIISYKDDVEVSINGVRIKLPVSETKLIK